jgi:hypothetical protein
MKVGDKTRNLALIESLGRRATWKKKLPLTKAKIRS